MQAGPRSAAEGIPLHAPSAQSRLAEHMRRTIALQQISGLLSWDQETHMPPRGASARAEQAAAIEAVAHAHRADPRIAEWADAIERDTLSPAERVSLDEALRIHRRAVRIPARLASALARTTTEAHEVWAAAREKARFDDFAPTLAEIVALKREEAACLAEPGQGLYDALLDDYEPGMTVEKAERLFGALRPALADLAARIAATGVEVALPGTRHAEDRQLALARELATVFGYDWQAGRLDLAVHPFSSGTLGDVRITTRIDPENPFENIYAAIHETGHAVYEQGMPEELAFTPAGAEASMGVHESQSRLFENQIGRSRAFCDWLFGAMERVLGPTGFDGPEALWRAANRVRPGFRRTEADEVHYNLHILMRFDLERALIAGDLAVGDLEAAWNDRFAADFGVAVPDAAQGVLQDIHWSAGLFGYFPTYSFGNIYAAELFAAMRADLPGLDAAISQGDIAPAIGWLREKIHRHGRLHAPDALIEMAVGHAPGTGPLIAYLEAKFAELYRL